MGRKSKNRAKIVKKNKSGGEKQQQPPSPLPDLVRYNGMANAFLEGGSPLFQGLDNSKNRALEGLLIRDLIAEAMKTADDPEKYDDKLKEELGEDKLGVIPALSQTLMATLTLQMAQCGLVEEDKHSSIVYVEEHADEIFGDGGVKFFREMKEATDRVEAEREKKSDKEEMINDGDTDGQRRMLQDLMSAFEKEFEDKLRHNTNIDDELFQPSSPREDCPICLLPLPGRDASTYQPCCGKFVCDGCVYSQRVATLNSRTEFCCPFCRDPAGDVNDCIAKSEERMKVGDREAYYTMGCRYLEGIPPLEKNTQRGLELVKQAAELGSEAAHATLGSVYGYGIYGVEKDMVKAMHHLRLAAIGGMLESRYLLGKAIQGTEPELAYRHFIIAAEEGHDESLKKVKAGYTEGHVEKDVFAKVLRAYQATKVSVKSEARDKAAKHYHRA